MYSSSEGAKASKAREFIPDLCDQFASYGRVMVEIEHTIDALHRQLNRYDNMLRVDKEESEASDLNPNPRRLEPEPRVLWLETRSENHNMELNALHMRLTRLLESTTSTNNRFLGNTDSAKLNSR